jgi:hypothetical protein
MEPCTACGEKSIRTTKQALNNVATAKQNLPLKQSCDKIKTLTPTQRKKTKKIKDNLVNTDKAGL